MKYSFAIVTGACLSLVGATTFTTASTQPTSTSNIPPVAIVIGGSDKVFTKINQPNELDAEVVCLAIGGICPTLSAEFTEKSTLSEPTSISQKIDEIKCMAMIPECTGPVHLTGSSFKTFETRTISVVPTRTDIATEPIFTCLGLDCVKNNASTMEPIEDEDEEHEYDEDSDLSGAELCALKRCWLEYKLPVYDEETGDCSCPAI